ncbi:[pt] maturase [Galdieria sulphuraria]|nr:[pt] maturase [Galdieria sulphuraria]EME26032.1 [pt] maturase [Galdieria sulphuraria]|eukprot:XP_005702552.1 [pt] maturase [Galdieria sulphuraria]
MINFSLGSKLVPIQNISYKNIARADLLDYLVDKKYSVDYSLLKLEDLINKVLNRNENLAEKYRYAIDLESYDRIITAREKREAYENWFRYRKYYLFLDRLRKGHITKFGGFDLEKMPSSYFKFNPEALTRSRSESKKLMKKQFDYLIKNYNFQFPDPSWWRLLRKPRHFPSLFKNLRSPNFPTKAQKNLMKALNSTSVFVVTDKVLKDMVIASPSWYKDRDFCDKFLECYYNNFVWTRDINYIHMGLIFFNPKDATLYKNSIIQRDRIGYKIYGARLFRLALSKAYKMRSLARPRLQMIFIPDYQELTKVITKYLNDPYIVTHPKQECSYKKRYFRGVPVYMIHPYNAIIKGKVFKNLEFTAYTDENSIKYPVVFFSRREADKMWREFIHFYRKNGAKIEGSYPKLILYNLEDLLVDCEENDLNPLFIPNNKITKDFLINYYNEYPEENTLDKVEEENWLTDFMDGLSSSTRRLFFSIKQSIKVMINGGSPLSKEELEDAMTYEFPSKIRDTRFKKQVLKPLEREGRNLMFHSFIRRKMIRDRYIKNYPYPELIREYIDYIVNNKYKF